MQDQAIAESVCHWLVTTDTQVYLQGSPHGICG